MTPLLGLAISWDDFAGIFVSALVIGYLVYALIRPENL